MKNPPGSDLPVADPSADAVLVVDDNLLNRTLLQELLRLEGYRVYVAEDGAEAVDLFSTVHMDLVLMDVMMPMMDGYAATRRIKELCAERDQYCPVLFVTAMTDEQSLVACIECGGDGFLVKPYNRVILRAKMRALERTRDLYALVQRQKQELEAHHERLCHEHEIAERTFSKLMQAADLDAPNLKHLLAPVGLASGDLLLAEYRPDGVQQILLGDFTGHGLAAAMGAIPVADIFQSMTRKGLGIDSIATEINAKLKAKLPVGLFLAACLLAIDASAGRMQLWNGGIPDVLCRRDRKPFARLKSRHLPLGILDHTAFDAQLDELAIQPGDCLYAYSDGLLEAINPQGEMFGEARLETALAADDGRPFAGICTALDAFRSGQSQHDDITLIEIQCPAPVVAWRAPEARKKDGALVSVECGPDRLRQDDTLTLLMRLLETFPELDAHRGRLYTVVAELFNNALDHGVLRLDSVLKRDADSFDAYYLQREQRLQQLSAGSIRIALRLTGDSAAGAVEVTIEDSGQGFDYTAEVSQLNAGALARRGLPLARALCSRLEFQGAGNRVEAVYHWPDAVA